VIFVGVDWSEDHHDIDILNEGGRELAARRIKHGVAGVAELHELIAMHADDPTEVKVGIETDRGLVVQALVAAGYEVFAINPRIADRYRDRHALSGAKSDALDARVLADLVRTDRHKHRPVAGDSDDAEELKMLARGHQNLIWSRTRHVLQLRSVLLEYFPAMVTAAGGHVGTRDALAVLGVAPDPAATKRLTRAKLVTALRRAGRVRNLERTAASFHEALQGPHLEATPGVLAAGRANASALSHAELDEAAELDAGDPNDLAARYVDLRQHLPALHVIGGCCGTDHRHVQAIADAFCNSAALFG